MSADYAEHKKTLGARVADCQFAVERAVRRSVAVAAGFLAAVGLFVRLVRLLCTVRREGNT
jgi:hypothetical protein